VSHFNFLIQELVYLLANPTEFIDMLFEINPA